jgi:tetratricopeptide (TPR) repeat protein
MEKHHEEPKNDRRFSIEISKYPRMKIDENAKYESMIADSIFLREEGKLEDALNILISLYPENFGEVRINVLIGHLLYLLNRFSEALQYLVIALELAPSSESASLGYFHTLCSMNRFQEALLEAIRYDKLKGTTEYVEILTDYVKLDFEGLEIDELTKALVVGQLATYPSGYMPPIPDSRETDSQRGTR